MNLKNTSLQVHGFMVYYTHELEKYTRRNEMTEIDKCDLGTLVIVLLFLLIAYIVQRIQNHGKD